MTERSEVQFGLTPIPFTIRRSAQRATVALAVENDGKLVVTAPRGVSVDALNRVVHRKGPWVIERIRRVSTLPPPPSAREFVTGETVLYLGRQLRLKVVETRKDDARTRIWAGWYHVPVRPGLAVRPRRAAVRRHLAHSLKQRANEYVPDRLVEVCRRIRIQEPTIIIREQKKRWGSCDSNGVLRLNWRVIQAPVSLIEYVLAHELTHLEHPKHGRQFWAALGRVMPDYEARRARLREIGPRLVW